MPMYPSRLGRLSQFIRGLVGGSSPPPPVQQPAASYRLNEDGGRRLREDGSFYLLES